jgi:hypothetical protein
MNPVREELERALDETLAFLDSADAERAIAANAYWPKWDGPWWRATLLWEMGLAAKIPERTARALVSAMARETVTSFPLRAEDVPAGKDPIRDVPCHCQLGTIWQVLAGRGLDREAPWIRAWFTKYQLPDGGWNCDEAAYLKEKPRSSVVSTVPVLESLLAIDDLTREEESALDRGARYLLERRLWRSVSKGFAPIDPEWIEPCFPRFYFYDVLRGLSVVARWAERLERKIPRVAIEEARDALEARAHVSFAGRRAFAGKRTLRQDASGAWTKTDASSFALLEVVANAPQTWLARSWEETRARLARLEAGGLVAG